MCKYEYRPLCKNEIFEVLGSADHCCLAMCENGQPYVVPMCYKWCDDGCHLWFYLSSEDCGEKMRCMRGNDKVCLEMEMPCKKSMKTVIIKGKVMCFEDKHHGCDCDSHECVMIKILAKSVSGREVCKPSC